MRMLAALLAALLAAGCAIDGVLEDERDDAFLGGKADDATLAEGTPAALGVLQVANEATLDVLDRADAVGLSRRAAEQIVARRPLATLAELDAVPYVGPVALDRLLAYAEANGFVPRALSGAGTCHETHLTYSDGGVCRVTATERDLRLRVEATVKGATVEIGSIREEHDLAQYVCRVLQGASCPAVMASPIVVRLDGAGSGSTPLGSTGHVHAALDGDQLDLDFSVEGDRRDLVCRGEVVRSFCTATLLAPDSN